MSMAKKRKKAPTAPRRLVVRPRRGLYDPGGDDVIRVHEAGHTLAAWLSPRHAPLTGLVVFRNGSGVTLTPDQVNATEPADLWHALVIPLAGLAAEAVVYDTSVPLGSLPDRADARRLALMAARVWPTAIRSSCPWIGDLPNDLPSFIKIRGGDPAELVTWIVNAAFWRARTLMEDEYRKLTTLVDALRRYGDKLDADEIAALIGPRPGTDRRGAHR